MTSDAPPSDADASDVAGPGDAEVAGVRDDGVGAAVWRGVQAVAAVLVLALFLYSLRDLLSPFVLFWVLLVVLLPFRGTPGHSLLVALAAVLTGIWLLETTGFLLAPFVLALVVAYILDPVVDLVERRRLPRSAAIGLLLVPVVGAAAAGIFWGIPALSDQIGSLVREAPGLLRRLAGWAEAAQDRFIRWDVPLVNEDQALARLQDVESGDVIAFLEERRADIAREIWGGILGLGRGLGSVLTVAGYVILTPVLTFFLLRDWDRLVEGIEELLPARHRDTVVAFSVEYDDLLSRYLRGQITVALTVGAITGAGLWIARFPYAFLLGAVVAVFSVVPYLGLVVSLVPAVVIALTSGDVWLSLLKVGVVYGAAQGLEGAVIGPRIVGGSVGLHPVWVALALAVGGFFFGFVGLLIAVPVAVGVKLALLRGIERYRSSELYRKGPEPAA